MAKERAVKHLKTNDGIVYFGHHSSNNEVNVYAIKGDVLVGASSSMMGELGFDINTKVGLNGEDYNLVDLGVRRLPLSDNNNYLTSVKGGSILKNLYIETSKLKSTKQINLCWVSGDNLKNFNNNLSNNLSLDESIKKTFSGKVLSELGFRNFSVFDQNLNSQGKYDKLEVSFYRG